MKIRNLLRRSLWLLPLLLLAGFTRFHELAWHFSHVDDFLVAERIQDMYARKQAETGLIATLDAWNEAGYRVFATSTYAPFGGYASAAFVWLAKDYRDTLFWGRFPNALAGILLVLLTAVLARVLFPQLGAWGGWLAGGWMLFSWENIIYSQQMTPYAYSQLAGLLVLGLSLGFAGRGRLSFRAQLWLWLGFAFAFYQTYQVIALFPAFVWVSYRGQWQALRRPQQLKWLGFALLVFIGAIHPLIKRLLFSDLMGRGINWNAGLHQEFVFNWAMFSDNPWYFVEFWTLNTWHVVQGLLGSAPPGTSLAALQAALLLACAALGAGYLFTSRSAVLRRYLLWTGLAAMGWALFVLAGRFSYSPTRHSMLWSPLFILLVVAGIAQLASWLRSCRISAAVLLVLLVPHGWGFIAYYAQERLQRQDAFQPGRLTALVETYQPQTVYTYYWSQQPTFVQTLAQRYEIRDTHFVRREALPVIHPPQPRQPLYYLFFSHRTPLDAAAWNYAMQGVGAQALPGQLADYKIVYTYAYTTGAEIEYSPLTQNGHNGCYITVISPRE
ncbi:MAG: hypothetical protein KF690_01620 [Bacteroidetes bacterium]|nr:hypothetical protein [Bacteroidota bacterium]